MRIIPFVVSAVITILLIFLFNNQWGAVPPMGKFLSPQHGFWRNAEASDASFNATIKLPQLHDKATVYFDERLIPHVFASNEEDAYFLEGYLHAKFRLWQMEFQVFAAGGRLSEILGEGPHGAYLNHDREMRRLGMVYAAEQSLSATEKDSTTKKDCDAYTAGVNAYIDQLNESDLPVEYKLLNYKPEHWTNLKIALFNKYIAYELAGGDDDFEMTNAKAIFSKTELAKLYPQISDSLDPVVPRGTAFLPPGVKPVSPAGADSLYFNNTDAVAATESQPEKDNGSNNWAVSGKKTKSGRPILCNDPHLGLNLPSIWYEMQIHTPEFNTYGVSFPGAPYIIIGFNDSCAWGVTNAGRDVRDYYDIRFKDSTKQQYWFNGEWKTATLRVEAINIKNKPTLYDTVAYTVFGPVIYDNKYAGPNGNFNGKYYAVRWKANDASNEFAIFSHLRSAKNYDDYVNAVKNLGTPGQNFIFASKAGDIALWQQGEFPAKWQGQGDFVMPGTDSSYMWQGNIPQDENPHMYNPERGFVSSANQRAADTAYPYYLGNKYPIYRGIIINRFLREQDQFTPEMMMQMQTNNYDVFAEMARPLLLKNIDEQQLSGVEKRYLDIFKAWRLKNDTAEQGPTIFKLWWNQLEKQVWDDDLRKTKLHLLKPFESTLLEALLKDSAYQFIDNIETPEKETLPQVVTLAFKQAIPDIIHTDSVSTLAWSRFKDTWARHLLRLPAFSRTYVPVGGGVHCINAAKQFHGPSWRMIVHLTDTTEAYGVYPGGQNGNPGSIFYDPFVDTWAAGKYYRLWMMNDNEKEDKRVKWKMVFDK